MNKKKTFLIAVPAVIMLFLSGFLWSVYFDFFDEKETVVIHETVVQADGVVELIAGSPLIEVTLETLPTNVPQNIIDLLLKAKTNTGEEVIVSPKSWDQFYVVRELMETGDTLSAEVQKARLRSLTTSVERLVLVAIK